MARRVLPHAAAEDAVSRGYFGVGVYHPKTPANIGTLWRTATIYGAAFLATIGCRYTRQPSDTCSSPIHTPLHHYSDVDDLLRHLPWSCPLIGVELTEHAVALDGYAHPLRALYLLGAEDYGLPPAVLERCHQVVRIPAVREQSLNVAVAGSIVLYDRHVKGSMGRAWRDRGMRPTEAA